MSQNLTTWGRWLYLPSEGKRATEFYRPKLIRPRPGLNPRTLGPAASTLSTRAPRTTRTVGTHCETTTSHCCAYENFCVIWHAALLCLLKLPVLKLINKILKQMTHLSSNLFMHECTTAALQGNCFCFHPVTTLPNSTRTGRQPST
jgi:hypothetical protein